MVEKAKLFYFGVFILVVFAFIFHVTAMGHHHWKKANIRDSANISYGFNYTNIGLFKRCLPPTDGSQGETCFPNMYPMNDTCDPNVCRGSNPDSSCSCDYLPSTKGIAACTIIAAIFLGLAIIILFTHSVNTAENRSVGLLLGLLPLFLLLLAFIFILIALILVGSYLSREIMTLTRNSPPLSADLGVLRDRARNSYAVRVDWSTGLEIISLFFTFLSLLLYSAFVFKFGRSS